MFKRKVIAAFFKWADGWNSEIHNNIESRTQSEYHRMFPNITGDFKKTEEIMQRMRDFYYMRISNTTNLLITTVALLVAFVSLLLSALALLKS